MPKRRLGASSQPENEYLRRRSYRACEECRRRKRKCDGQLPCSTCAGYGYHCNYESAQESPSLAEVQERHRSSPAREEEDSSRRSKGAAAHKDLPDMAIPSLPATIENAPAPILVTSSTDRVASNHSAAAQPMILSHAFNDSNPLKIHPFAWNLGIGHERRVSHVSKLHSYISKQESLTFVGVYFQVVHPTFAFLQRDVFCEKLESKWSDLQSDPAFESVLCGVVALGSFFSSLSYARESEIFSQGASILDLANLEPLTPLNLDIMAGWILRTIYLRLTTRFHMACHASNTAVHTAQMLCLHRDMPTEQTSPSGAESTTQEDYRARHFWVAWSLNIILSIESGLDPIRLGITCQYISYEQHTHSEKLVLLAQILDDAFSKNDTKVDWQQIHTQVKQIQNIGAVSALISVFQADVCLCLLRKAMHISTNIKPSLANLVVAIVETAFEKIHSLVEHRLPWWNVATVPFPTICVCLTINSVPILSLLPGATKLLQLEADVFDSHTTKEALSTARHLIKAAQAHDSLKENYRALALSTDAGPNMHSDSLFQADNGADWSISF